jgi:hypothetical protein
LQELKIVSKDANILSIRSYLTKKVANDKPDENSSTQCTQLKELDSFDSSRMPQVNLSNLARRPLKILNQHNKTLVRFN